MHWFCRGPLLILMLSLGVLFLPAIGFGEEWVEAEGRASLSGTTREAAQAEAVRDAMRNAVQTALGAMVASETLVENFVLVKDKILTRVDGYVRHYDIVSKECAGSECSVKIRAQVEEMALADDVAALANILPMMNYPTVVVAFAQKTLGQDLQDAGLDMGTVEQAFYEVMGKKGFRLAEASALDAERLRQATLKGMTGKQTGMALETAAPLAQVMIAGEAVVQDSGATPYNDKVHAYGAFLSGKVYETGTGRVLAAGSANASVPHSSFAIGTQKAAEKAAAQLAEDLAGKIVQGWLQACYNEHDVTLVVENIPFGQVEPLMAAIMKNIKGALRVNQKSFLNGRAELAVGWRNCNTQRLATMLKKMPAGGASLQVVEVQGNSIRVTYGGK